MSTAFNQLMAMASKRTTEQQAALAKEAEEREARDRRKRTEAERKEAERLRVEKARLEKQRADDAAREAALRHQREQRLAERPEKPTAVKAPRATLRHGKVAAAGASSGLKGKGQALDSEAQWRQEREMKAAKAKAKLFEDDEPISASRPQSGRMQNPAKPGGRRPRGNDMPHTRNPPTDSESSSQSTRARLVAAFSEHSLTRLNTAPRDTRTIAEVERDMRLRRLQASGVNVEDLPPEGSQQALWRDPRAPPMTVTDVDNGVASANGKGSTATPASSFRNRNAPPRSEGPTDPLDGRHASAEASKSPEPPRRKRPGQPDHAPRGVSQKSKKARVGTTREARWEPREAAEEDANQDMREVIWGIMGKSRSQYVGRRVDSDGDSGSDGDMEAGAGDVFREEGRASRLARLEDQREEEANRRHEQEKKVRLSAARGRA